MKKLLLILLTFIFSVSLFSCAGKTEEVNKPSGTIPNIAPSQSLPFDSELDSTVYTVSLIYNKKEFTKFDNDVYVIFYNGSNQQKALIDKNSGTATIKNLDGVYSIYLSDVPVRNKIYYSYNPNIYVVDEETKDVNIELSKVYTPKSGNGSNLYTNIYQLDIAGSYCAKITSSSKLYFEFTPKTSGTYVVESYVNIYENIINPICYRYYGSSANKNEDCPAIYDDGGSSLKNGFTKNFKFSESFDKSNLGNIIAFGLTCDLQNSTYPVNIYFSIKNVEDYSYSQYEKVKMIPNDIKEKTPNFKSTNYRTCVENIGGVDMLVGSHYKYNEEDGYYHVYDSSTNTYGPTLVISIKKSIPCFDGESFYTIEDKGNKALVIVINGVAYDYQGFLTGEKYYDSNNPYGEISYLDYLNSDGVCYLTKELKEFAQRYSISQRLFFDGDGIMEYSQNVYATENDQWLFACGYYVEA